MVKPLILLRSGGTDGLEFVVVGGEELVRMSVILSRRSFFSKFKKSYDADETKMTDSYSFLFFSLSLLYERCELFKSINKSTDGAIHHPLDFVQQTLTEKYSILQIISAESIHILSYLFKYSL